MQWLFVIYTSPIIHQWLYTTCLFRFSWDDCDTQENWETKIMQNFGGKQCVLDYGKCANSEYE